jgi:hypothetical protein
MHDATRAELIVEGKDETKCKTLNWEVGSMLSHWNSGVVVQLSRTTHTTVGKREINHYKECFTIRCASRTCLGDENATCSKFGSQSLNNYSIRPPS